MTNFEKIKSMSIDEMAEFFYKRTGLCDFEPCRKCPNQEWCDCSSIEDFEKWLNSVAN